MADFKNGDKVTVKLEGTGTVEYDNNNGSYDVRMDDTNRLIEYLPVAALTSETWPPRPGDVWEANGKLYGIARSTLVFGSYVVREVFTGSIEYQPRALEAHRKLDAFQALNPTLVKRPDAR